MKLDIDIAVKDLQTALAGNVAGKSTAPMYEHALLEFSKDALTLRTINHVCQYSITVPCTTKSPGTITAMPDKLKSAINGLTGTVNLAMKDDDKNQLVLSQKITGTNRSRRFTMPTLPAQDWPAFEHEDTVIYPVQAETLLTALNQVSYAAAKNDVRRMINGVLLGQGYVAATDGHRMAAFPLKDLPADITEIIIPADALPRVADILKDENAAIALTKNGTHLYVTGKNRILIVRLIDGKYPLISRLIPKASKKHTVSISKIEAAAVLSRATALELSRLKDEGLRSHLRLKKTKNAITVTGKSTDEIITCECEETGEELGIDGRYLSEAINAIDAENIDLQFSDIKEKYMLTGGDKNAIHMIMPMR